MLAFILSSIFVLWRFGKESQWAAESTGRIEPAGLIQTTDSVPHLTATFGGAPVTTVNGLGIFFDKIGDPAAVPISFAQFIIKFAARPRVLLFFHMRPLPVPFVPLDERYVITRTRGMGQNCYNVVLRHGYADNVLHPGLSRELVGQVELAVAARAVDSQTTTTTTELDVLRAACDAQTVYVLGKETMRTRKDPGVVSFFRRVLLGSFLWIRENSRTKLADLDIDADKLIEVGFVKEI
jgi:KUP system potassium uptake protein